MSWQKLLLMPETTCPRCKKLKKTEAEFIAILLNTPVTLITSKGEITYKGGNDNVITETNKRTPSD